MTIILLNALGLDVCMTGNFYGEYFSKLLLQQGIKQPFTPKRKRLRKSGMIKPVCGWFCVDMLLTGICLKSAGSDHFDIHAAFILLFLEMAQIYRYKKDCGR